MLGPRAHRVSPQLFSFLLCKGPTIVNAIAVRLQAASPGDGEPPRSAYGFGLGELADAVEYTVRPGKVGLVLVRP
ncbi:hypothetical protein [Streptomyces sp. NPDC057909]|uniref:hypothetical protein n=1 Tax=unclassified Streptomyces TaxID=2593676 RepID=UPI0036E0FD00